MVSCGAQGLMQTNTPIMSRENLIYGFKKAAERGMMSG